VGYEKFESSRMHRKAMLEVITRLVPEGTVRFDRRVLGVRQRRGKGEMRFEDGECVVVDALVGCIGIRGVMRAVLQERWPEVAAKYTTTYVREALRRWRRRGRLWDPMRRTRGSGRWKRKEGDVSYFVRKGGKYHCFHGG
jgi:hypothetical protein